MDSEKQLVNRKEKEDSTVYRLPGWILGWFYATAVICTWDASFIMCRPHSMPGGSLSFIWKPYTYYISVDQRYTDLNDPFVFGISLFNYLEVFLNIVTIILHHSSSRHTIPLAFTVSVMTFWKTLFYVYAYSDCGGGAQYRGGNTALEEFFIFLVPNGFWILVPFAIMMSLWSKMMPEVSDANATSQGNGIQVRSSRVSKKQA